MEAHSLASNPGGLILPRSRKFLAALGDERLVEQLRRGNDAAFEVLYDRHHAGVLSYCRHMLGSRDEAEDALQQAFVSAHADIVASDKPIRFKAWIYTIARNRCLSLLRARREQPSDDLERLSTTGLSEQVEHRAELKHMLADLHELPPEQRSALILSELGDLSHADVAEVIGCEVQKVKSLVFQARSGLIERRQARETSCAEIREQLATLRGGSLRRGPLRRHVKACPGCSEFRDEVRRQRQMVAVLLPVVPTIGLKETALAAAGVGVGGGSAVGGGVLGGGAAAVAAKAGVAKVAVIAVATGSAVGGAVAIQQESRGDGDRGRGSANARSDSAPALPASGAAPTADPMSSTPAERTRADRREGGAGQAGDRAERDRGERRGDRARGEDGARSAPGTQGGEPERGFEPVRGGSNGERARDFARTRGKGRKRGLEKPIGRQEIARGGSHRSSRGGPKGSSRGGPNRSSRGDSNRSSKKPKAEAPQRPASPPGRGQEKSPEQPPTAPVLPDLVPRGGGLPQFGALNNRPAAARGSSAERLAEP